MAETPEELFERARGRLRRPSVEEWQTFPFAGELRLRELLPPLEVEPPRVGESSSECWRCATSDDVIWSSEQWTVTAPSRLSGLPIVVFANSRAHLDLDDVDDDLAADMGLTLVRVHRAVASVPHVGRVHVCRWGDGSFHLHWWLMGRPERLPQVRGTLAAIWDDVLPPTPDDVWRSNLDHVATALRSSG